MMPAPHYMMKTFTDNGLAYNNLPRATVVEFPTTDDIVVKNKYLPQILATLAVCLGTFTAGLGKGYSSPAISSLQQNAQQHTVTIATTFRPMLVNISNHDVRITSSADDIPLTITSQEASWLASLSLLGALFGAMFSGVAMKFGRRNVLLAVSLPFCASWLLTSFAFNVGTMLATSFVGGFCCATVITVSQVYVSEISTSSIRGCLNAITKIFSQIGMLISFAMGAYLDWKQLAMAISLAPMALFFATLYIPETPSYLTLKERDGEAIKSLRWIKGADSEYEIKQELAIIKANIARGQQRKQFRLRDDVACNLYHPIVITCGLMFFQRFTGAQLFNFYAVPIFKRTFTSMNPHSGAILVGVVQLMASLLSGLLIDTVGRLPLLVVSSVFMSIALASFGSYAYFIERIHTLEPTTTTAQYDWIPLLCVLTFTVAYSLGINPISLLMVGELFPIEYRGLGTSIAMSFGYGCAFVSVKTFVDFEQLLGLHGTYWLYSACSVAGLCFVICCVPETKGRKLNEMDQTNVMLKA